MKNLADVIFSIDIKCAMEQGFVWKGHFNIDAVDEIFSWEKIDEIIFLQRIGCDRLRVSRGDRGPWNEKNLFSSEVGSDGKCGGFLLVEKLHQVLEEGATVIVEAVNEASVLLNGMVEDIVSQFCARSSINAYMSFGNQPGFGVHYDDQDLIVVQIDGRKKWDFFHCNEYGHPIDDFLMRSNENDVSMSFDLECGDVLYVPKGVWHQACGVGAPSLHLAIGIEYPSVSDFLHWIINQNRKSVPFNSIRPYNFVAEKVSSDAMEFLHAVCEPKGVQKFMASYYARMRGVRVRPDLLNRFSVSHKDVFARVPLVLLGCGGEEGVVDVNALDRIFKLSMDEFCLLDQMGKRGKMSYVDALNALPDSCIKSEKERMLSGLLKAGLVTKINHRET